MKFKYCLAAVAAALLFFSCDKEGKEKTVEPVLSLSTDSLKLSCEAAQPVFTVTSNRSWKIEMPESCDWISADPLAGGEEGKNAVDVQVTLTIAAYNLMDAREYTLYVVPDDPQADLVPLVIVQSGAPASISVSSPNPVDDIANSGADVVIEVLSNTAWTAVVKDGGSASVTLDKTAGSGNGSITATVAENKSLEAVSATVVISAAGCTDIEVVLNQKAADLVPELKAEIPEAGVYVDPSVFSSLGGTRWFSVKSNVPWTAKLGSGTTASGVSLKTSSGTGDLDKFEVTAGPNKDLDNRKAIEIVFEATGIDPVTVSLAQEKGSILAFEFRDQANTEASWPFDQTPATEAGDRGPGQFTVAGYTVAYNAITDCMIESKYGWRIGKGVGGWIQTPAIEGRRLAKVTIADYNVGYAPTITTANDAMTVIKKGGADDLDGPFTRNVPATWTLPETEAGTSYRIVCNADKTMRVMHLVFEYAEPSVPDPTPDPASTEVKLADKGASWYVEPGVLSSIGCNPDKANALHGRRPVYITASKSWTARLGEGTTASGAALSQTSGEAGESVIYVSVGQNTSFDTEKKVVVEVLVEGEQTVSVELTQQPAKILAFEFRTFDRSALCWPFEEAAYTETGHSGSGTYKAGAYTVGYNAAADNMTEDGYGWRIGAGTACYIETPAIAGHKLVKVSIADGNANTNPNIVTTAGEVVSGGAFADRAEGSYVKGGAPGVWTLSDTENGTSYRITPTANKTMRTLHLVLEYE